MVLDALSKKFSFSFKPFIFGLLGEKFHNNRRILFVKPNTYMNRSGDAVRYVLFQEDERDTSKLLVVHDDMDLELGSIKLKWDGGDGGHRGVRSIVQAIGTKEFFRLKMGIGRPPKGVPASDFVLSEFSEEEREKVRISISKAVRLFDFILDVGPFKAWELYRMEEEWKENLS